MDKNSGSLLILGAAHSLNHSLFLVLPPLLEVVSKDINSSFHNLGIVTTISYFLYGLGALIGGPLSDYVGRVKITRISIGLSGASTFLFIFSRDIYTFGLTCKLAIHLANKTFKKKLTLQIGKSKFDQSIINKKFYLSNGKHIDISDEKWFFIYMSQTYINIITSIKYMLFEMERFDQIAPRMKIIDQIFNMIKQIL